MASFKFLILILLLLALSSVSSSSSHHLSSKFYSHSCPRLFPAVKSVVQSAIRSEARIGASLLRLFFHDCFVNGCDGSILLDDTGNFTGEKGAIPNNNSVRGFDVVDRIKASVERVCPGIVSCADVLAIAARDSVEILGGPTWKVKLGRRDARTANITAANNGIPPPTSNLTALVSRFNALGLTTKDLVALSGSHTIGQARCTTFRSRIYNETNIDASFARARRVNCPISNGTGDGNLAPLDLETPTKFDNRYFKNLVENKGLLHSDQQLYNGAYTDSVVERFVNRPESFERDFVVGMIRMGNISPLTGSDGEIRKSCRRINS